MENPKHIVTLTFHSDNDLVETAFASSHLITQAAGYEHKLELAESSIHKPSKYDLEELQPSTPASKLTESP